MRSSKMALLVVLLCLYGVHVSSFPFTSRTHPVIMISFDGFRYDYLEIVKAKGIKTPNFDLLISHGVRAEYMKNAFITKTFPNHYTLVTGMYEENHGVVSNNMFDPRYNETFTLALSDQKSDALNKWFTNDTDTGGPEPIWVTNQKGSQEGVLRLSGVVMWPGSTAKVHGQYPHYLVPYNRSVPNNERIDHVVDWLTRDKDPVNLALCYFSEPDHTGHQTGPYSDEIAQVIQTLDQVLGYLIDKLTQHGIFEDVDVIVTSDHGMMEITNTTIIEDYNITADMYTAFGSSPVLSVMPKGSKSAYSL